MGYREDSGYCLSLLDLVPEDSRDGLFLACFRLNSFNIYEKLVKKFHEWIIAQDWGEGLENYMS